MHFVAGPVAPAPRFCADAWVVAGCRERHLAAALATHYIKAQHLVGFAHGVACKLHHKVDAAIGRDDPAACLREHTPAQAGPMNGYTGSKQHNTTEWMQERLGL